MDMRIDRLSDGPDRFEDAAREKRRKHRPSPPPSDAEYEDRYEPSQAGEAGQDEDPQAKDG